MRAEHPHPHERHQAHGDVLHRVQRILMHGQFLGQEVRVDPGRHRPHLQRVLELVHLEACSWW
ncbi:hypothetical protein ASD08_47085 [Streptomyces sp. Root369]|nr:hypothetical protein ASD08_47085 [Streptomyces sp. Root369]